VAGSIIDEAYPVSPETLYAESKLEGETVVREWCAERGVDYAIFRLSQVYGEGDSSPKVIPRFVREVVQGRPPRVRGSGLAERQPIHVEDVAGAVRGWAVDEARMRGSGVCNLAGPDCLTIRELACLCMRAAGMAGEPVAVEAEHDTTETHFRFDLTRTEWQLNWTPAVGIEDGIRRVIEWERKRVAKVPDESVSRP